MEVWIYLALGAAILNSVLNINIKSLGGRIDEYAAGFFRHLVILPALWIILFASGIPAVDPNFWKLILIMLPFEYALVTFYQKAFKHSDMSLIVPILSLAPIFIALVSFLLFRESLTFYYVLALLAFVAGVYFLNLKPNAKHVFSPLAALFEDKGAFYMFLVAVILGVTVSLGKQAIVASSPQFFSAVYFSLVTIILFPRFLRKSDERINGFFKHKFVLLSIAVVTPIQLMFSFYALKLGPTSVAQSLILMSSFFSVVLAGAFLKEKGIKKRIFASLLILLGSILIVLK